MEIQTEKCTLKELFPQTSVSSVIDLCGGKLWKFNSLAFLTTFLLFQGLNVPSFATQASSQGLALRDAAMFLSKAVSRGFVQWHRNSPLTLERWHSNGRVTLRQKPGSLIFRERYRASQVILQLFCQTLKSD